MLVVDVASSRRRHTRCLSDWSSDVCSSDLIVISGDTRKTEAIVEQCHGCDILVHEVYSTEGFKRRPPEWQRYHARYHTSSAELAELASRARDRKSVV